MDTFLKTSQAAISGMNAQSRRISLISQNLANVDTPGYHRKIAQFKVTTDNEVSTVRPTKARLDNAPLREIFEPSHLLADERGYVKTSNVNLLVEMADARQAQRGYEANLEMLNQGRELTSKLFNLLSR